MQMIFALLCLMLAAASPSYSQGRSAVAIAEMAQTAQSVALGDNGAALTGLNALGANPAGLYSPRPEVLTQYQQLPLQTNLAMLGASYPLSPLDASFALSYLTLRSADFDRRDESGNASGRFSTEDHMIGLHLSRPVGFGLPMTAGLGVKYVRLGIDSRSADAVAFDLGGRYRLSGIPLSLGLSVRNLGRGPRFDEQSSALPTSYDLSAAYRLSCGLDVLANYTKHARENRERLSVGAQFWVGGLFAMRGGYAMAREVNSSRAGLQNLVAGVGFKLLGRHMLDYAFQPFDSSLQQVGAVGTHLITFTMSFAQRSPSYGGAAWSAGTELEPDMQAERTSGNLLEEARRAMKEGRFSLAALRFGQAADADPSNRDLHGLLHRVRSVADIFHEATQGEGAMPAVRRAAQAYVYGGDLPGAVRLLRQAWNEAPGNARLLALLDRVEEEAGMEPTEGSWSGEAPQASYVEHKLAAARRALQDARPAAAMKWTSEALAVEPRNLLALELLGSAHYLSGERQKARELWRRVLQIDPENKDVVAFLKWEDR